jgi:Ca-activated chloride channel family protein
MWLLGALFALLVGGLFVLGGLGIARATRRFGDAERVRELLTGSPVKRRAWKAVAVVVATALAFVALARPQYGRGTRLIPATNLDVVVVLDFSKSMYARDVSPSRIGRAKAEVARLIHDLAGARFGAVAFAGEPIAFPLTSDGGAIAQFFRQLEPNDMPIGGTAIARALERAREIISRDPKSRDHSRVILLVTDGEDLEGDPVEVARAAGQDGIVVDVVQIGGRTPERIPEINAEGKVAGYRQDESGQVLTTSLSAEGEAQLAQVAQAANGQIIRSERGATGIDTVARELRRKMTEELSERVETVYADVYAYPLGAALLLLILEVFLAETVRKKGASVVFALMLLPFALGTSGCGWDPSRPFDREAPEVKRALSAMDAGDAASAAALLESYLGTGACADGGMGVPEKLRERPSASFDLGLVLFQIGERYGRRFGDEEVGRADAAGPSPGEQELAELRSNEVECALRAVLAIANEPDVAIDLRARAHYLAGNLEFLRRQYEEAVRHYDEALKLIPGLPDGGDQVGRDAAWNRAIALVRIEDEKKRDAGHDGPPQNDGGSDAGNGGKDASDDKKPDGGSGPKDSGKNDPGKDGGGDKPDAGDGQDAASPPPPTPEAGAPPSQPPPQSGNQDERMLDMLEAAPTLQQQDAKNRAAGRKVRGMADK